MAGTTNATVARRALALSMRRSELLLDKLVKKSAYGDMDSELLAELRADGEDI